MHFKKLTIKYENDYKTFEFSNNNLIFSKKNSVGKSTVLRLLFWSLGYPIPGTYKLHFDKVTTELLFHRDDSIYKIKRTSNFLELDQNGNLEYYSLTNQLNDELLMRIWGTSSLHVSRNILGAIYMDQDKGWTLLNRGKVIGNIRFNIRDLLLGLDQNDSPDDDLIKLDSLSKTLNSVNQLIGIKSSAEQHKDEESLSTLQESDKEYNNLLVKKNIKKREVQSLSHQLNSEESEKSYILSSNISIKHNGEIITVTDDNLLFFEDTLEYLRHKLIITQQELENTEYKIKEIENKFTKDSSVLFEEKDIISDTLDKIANIKVSQAFLEKRKYDLSKEINQLNKKIETDFIEKNNLIEKTSNWVKTFAKELEVDKYITNNRYIFTRNTKSISGTTLHKLVFCFKMAYIKIIEEYCSLQLPIVLDSPSGREVTLENTEKLISILNVYFDKNQIIIASIHNYNLKDINILELKNSIFDDIQKNENTLLL